MARTLHTAECRRQGSWWVAEVVGVPQIRAQTKRLDQVKEAVKGQLASLLEVPLDSFDVEVRPFWDAEVTAALHRVQEATSAAADAAAVAAAARREAAALVVQKGFPMRDAAVALGNSPQRIHQLVQEQRDLEAGA